jgi:hypothetical protein
MRGGTPGKVSYEWGYVATFDDVDFHLTRRVLRICYRTWSPDFTTP